MFQNSSNHEKQAIVLMISNGKEWHYFAVKKYELTGITSKYYCEFYCLSCLHSFKTKNKLELHKIVCENKNFCNVIIPFKDTKLLAFNPYQKSYNAPIIIYADLECVIEKIDG